MSKPKALKPSECPASPVVIVDETGAHQQFWCAHSQEEFVSVLRAIVKSTWSYKEDRLVTDRYPKTEEELQEWIEDPTHRWSDGYRPHQRNIEMPKLRRLIEKRNQLVPAWEKDDAALIELCDKHLPGRLYLKLLNAV